MALPYTGMMGRGGVMTERWTRQDWVGLLVVVGLAVMARFLLPGLVEFKHDEAYLSLLAQDALARGDLPLVGMPSSVGVPNAPTSVWLMMLPYALTNNPLVATLFVAALNVAGVAVLYLLARRMLGRAAATSAGVLYALSPWAVLFSRKIWAQDMHTPFLLLGLYLGWRGFVEGRRWGQILCLPVLVFALQTHYAAWVLLPLWFVLVGYGRGRIKWPSVALSVGLAALVLAPFGVGLWQTVQTNPALLSGALGGEAEPLRPTLAALRFHGQLATGLGLVAEVTGDADALPDIRQLSLLPAVLLAGLIGVGVVRGVMARRRAVGLLLAWLGLSVVVFSLTWTQVFIHYFVTSLPALCALAGLGVAYLTELFAQGNKNTNAAASRRGLLGIIGAVQALVWLQVLLYVGSTYSPAFGAPLRDKLAARAGLGETFPSGSRDVVLLSDGYRVRLDEEAAAWSVMLRGDACLRVTDGGAYRVSPPGAYTLLVDPDAPESLKPEADSVLDVPIAQSERVYSIYLASGSQLEEAPVLPSVEPVQYESGVRLVGAEVAGEILLLGWEMPEGQIGLDLQYFAHFLDADGERVAQRDGDFIPGRFWCAGDTVVTQISVAVPAEAVRMDVGLYQLDDERGFINQNVVGPDGAVLGTSGSVPLP